MMDFLGLKNKIGTVLSPLRYSHVLNVEAIAVMLAELLCPASIDTVRAAALLHDIAKELDFDEQIALIGKHRIAVTDEDLEIVPALHAIGGVALIKEMYPEFELPEVLQAVKSHCVGNSSMTLIDKIIYVSDFIELGRTYNESIRIREFLLDGYEKLRIDEQIIRLDKAVLMIAESTKEYLQKRGQRIHSKTLEMIIAMNNLF